MFYIYYCSKFYYICKTNNVLNIHANLNKHGYQTSCLSKLYPYIMNNVLAKLGNIPVTSSIIESLYPQLKGGSQK